jgi:hypothetical protein
VPERRAAAGSKAPAPPGRAATRSVAESGSLAAAALAAARALAAELARREGRAAWWTPGAASLPAAVRDRPPPLGNREGSAAAVGFLAAAAAVAPSALPLARRGARGLAWMLEHPQRWIGAATPHRVPGLLYGAGTWALGSAGAVAALVAVARATGERADAARCARLLADLDPEVCAAADASLGAGTAGIACVLQAAAEATRQPALALAAEHWHLRTLRCRRPGAGIGGYLYCDALAAPTRGGGRWAPRPGLLEGAAGTALSLLCAARGARRSPWLWRLLLG